MTSCSIELGDGVMENVSSGGVRRFSGLNLLVIENEFAVSHRGDDVAGVVWSYFPRRRINDKDIQFDRNDFGAKEDLINFAKN